jgi:hypothetical protein
LTLLVQIENGHILKTMNYVFHKPNALGGGVTGVRYLRRS